MLAFLGHEQRDSPYNLLAVSGFASFVLIVFWSKLELRVLHADVIPVAIGVLVLVQLFGGAMDPGTRHRVRPRRCSRCWPAPATTRSSTIAIR